MAKINYHSRTLIKVGGSVCVPLPPVIQRKLQVHKGDEMVWFIDGFHVSIENIINARAIIKQHKDRVKG